jgi:hypothetical protein
MRSIPVKETAFAGFTCVMEPEAKLAAVETGEVRKDRRTGQTVWTVGLCAMRGRDSSVVQVAVVGEPKGLRLGATVRVVDLEATPWERDGRSGIAWRAAAVVPSDVPVAGAAGGSGPVRTAGKDAQMINTLV